MRFAPIKMELSIMEAMVMIHSLDYMIADTTINNIDRGAAEKLRQRIVNITEERGIETDGE